jgi:hypothetical protein
MMKRTGMSFVIVMGNSKTLTLDHLSVVIKVGMVGDSQIGKTSLMVKYVEGSFDEDYIQTLGMFLSILVDRSRHLFQASISWRRPFLFVEQPSPFQYGIWADSASL